MQDSALHTLIEVGHGLFEETEPERILTRVLEVARELTGARYAALGVLNERRDALERFVTVGLDDATREALGDPPRGHGVLGELIRDPQPLRLADVGAHPHSYGFPIGHPPMTSFLGVPILIRGQAWGNLYLTDKHGGDEFSADDEKAVSVLAEWAAIGIANARRLTDVRDRRDELERTVAAMRATVEISRALAGETDLEVVLELIAKRGRALLGARALLIELMAGDRIRIAAVAGEVDRELVGAEMPLDGSVSGQAVRARRVERLSDELNRARFEEAGLGRLGLHAESGIFVPLVFRTETPGVLAAFDPAHGGDFTADDERLLTAFATSAASAVVTARSVTADQLRAREIATEDERRRWARELHDETLQGIAALRLALAVARRAEDPDRWRTAIGEAVAELDTEIANLRGIIADVRPATLDELGTLAALESLADRMRARGIDVQLSVDLAYESGRADTRHVDELETAIYRVVQEGINNAIKHAGVDTVDVDIRETERELSVRIRDEGRGFHPASRSEGFGLAGMRERIDALGGTLAIESGEGAGTTLTIALPIRRRASENGVHEPPVTPADAARTASTRRSAASSKRT
jgi:signal transduction histidine kinase